MPGIFNPETGPYQPAIYQIRLKGQLDERWTDWFGGMAVALTEDGDTLLTGPVADQAALHGLRLTPSYFQPRGQGNTAS